MLVDEERVRIAHWKTTALWEVKFRTHCKRKSFRVLVVFSKKKSCFFNALMVMIPLEFY